MKIALMAVVGTLVLFMLTGYFAGNTPEGQEKDRERRAIKTCWEEQGRKSHAPAEARFIAGACERMESDFRTKYGVRP